MKKRFQHFFLWATTTYLRLTDKNEAISFPTAFRTAHTVLIILPSRDDELRVACRTLSNFQKVLTPRAIYLLVHQDLLDKIPDNWKERTVAYDKKSISLWSSPKKTLLSKIKNVGADIIINLNPAFDLFSAVLSIKSNATLRICLYNENGEYFFNLQINDSNHQFLDQRYGIMLKYIDLLSGPPSSYLKEAFSPSH